MERAFIIDNFNTFNDWRLILTAKSVTPPQVKTKYVSIDGMSGTLDLSESLSGEVTYNDRTVSASFILAEGTYSERNRILRGIVNKFHGKKVRIIEPDDPTHYFLGRVTVKTLENRLPYGEISLEIICEPWRYSITESVRRVEINGKTEVVINNTGAKTVCPDIEVTSDQNIDIFYDTVHSYLPTGTHKIANIKLRPGANVIEVSGSGTVAFTYREADL